MNGGVADWNPNPRVANLVRFSKCALAAYIPHVGGETKLQRARGFRKPYPWRFVFAQ